MPTFTPPVRVYNPPIPFRKYRDGLSEYLPGTPKGVNVFIKPDGSAVENLDPGNAIYTYLGGHIYDITDAEAAILVADGYTVDYSQEDYGSGIYGSGSYGGS